MSTPLIVDDAQLTAAGIARIHMWDAAVAHDCVDVMKAAGKEALHVVKIEVYQPALAAQALDAAMALAVAAILDDSDFATLTSGFHTLAQSARRSEDPVGAFVNGLRRVVHA